MTAEGIVEKAATFTGVVRGPKFVIGIQLRDCFGQPMPGAPYELVAGSERRIGTADDEGRLIETLATQPQKCQVTWRVHEESYSMELFLDVLNIEDDEGVRRRLHNMGYPYELPLADNIRQFRLDQGLNPSDTIDSETRQKIQKIHDSGEVFETGEMEESTDESQEDYGERT